MAGGETGERSFIETRTFSLALIFFIFIALSLIVERFLHALKSFFGSCKKKALIEAVHNIEAELMLLGLFSLVLSAFSDTITKICFDYELPIVSKWYISDQLGCDCCLLDTKYVSYNLIDMCIADEEHPTCWDDPKVKAKYHTEEGEAIHVEEHVGEDIHVEGEKDAHADVENDTQAHAGDDAHVDGNTSFRAYEKSEYRYRRLRQWEGNFYDVEGAGAIRVVGRALKGGVGGELGGGVQRGTRRLQAEATGHGEDDDECTPVISSDTLHQVHIFVFLIAVCHIINTIFVGTLAYFKIMRWRGWAAKSDPRLQGVRDVLDCYHIAYTDILKQQSTLSKFQSKTGDTAGPSLQKLVEELNSSASLGFQEVEKCQPQLCTLKKMYRVQLARYKSLKHSDSEGQTSDSGVARGVDGDGGDGGGEITDLMVAEYISDLDSSDEGENKFGEKEAGRHKGHNGAVGEVVEYDEIRQTDVNVQESVVMVQSGRSDLPPHQATPPPPSTSTSLHLPIKQQHHSMAKSAAKSMNNRGVVAINLQTVAKAAFLQMFFAVSEVEFYVARASFMLTHKLTVRFDFQEYLEQCYQEDFSKLTGLNVPMWACIILIILGGGPLGWLVPDIAILSIILLFIANTKQKLVVYQALGDHTMRLLDSQVFWRQKPGFLMHFMRFTLYCSSFIYADAVFFAWQFGIHSCYFTNNSIRTPHMPWWIPVVLAVITSLHLGLVAIPTFSLATQLGSMYKKHLLPKKVQDTLLHRLKLIRKKKGSAAKQIVEKMSNAQSATLRAVGGGESQKEQS